MFRIATIATTAALFAAPALASDCNWGNKAAKATTAQGGMTYSQPVASTSFTAAPATFTTAPAVYTSVPATYTTTQAGFVATPVGYTQSADIVDTAMNAGSFQTLVAAVQAAGLVDTLKGDGPFTVFAPTDAAFAALPAGTVETLLKPENIDQLRAVLTYHVVPGKVTSDQLAGQFITADTVNGQSVTVNGTAGVQVDNATVTKADIMTSNGVIHVIDTVLLPSS